ncbi:alanyl-tRNA synthetase [Diaminobutyricimonas aerilata]|uniref:Alanyl-tRNA synthetase n=1 Tax=Diaminobutyricimonas aerilata TaxID=1162967 RepID=A0A2M9CJ17_9MICO|nr:metal-dependent hydrolase [Diaminobutyricimonas aerilata]PJJ71884.1 alanyl-tRNA synthetase [Diaminobutyricimonas aerilata]
MTLPARDTTVLYPSSALGNTTTVLHVEALGDARAAVLLEATAFHPRDEAWPDQGADAGELLVGDTRVPIVDAVVAATDGASLHLGREVPVRKGTDGWAFVVAHLVDAAGAPAEGDTVTVSVDGDLRRALSVGHTACHLASLALNAALASAWRKEVQPDAAGSPDFDALAIETSTITADGSVDVYRIGKSLRRKGFDPAALDDVQAVGSVVNARLAEWTAAGIPITIESDGPDLTDRRRWRAELPDGVVTIPCGGTHASSTDETGGITVGLETSAEEGAVRLVMTTRAHPPRP